MNICHFKKIFTLQSLLLSENFQESCNVTHQLVGRSDILILKLKAIT